MQTNGRIASINTAVAPRLPDLGQNKILQAVADYEHMEAELQHTKIELQEYISLASKLQAENDAIKNQMAMQTEFLSRQVVAATARADILDSTLTALRANYKTIRDVFVRCETEALQVGLAMTEKAVVKPVEIAPLPPKVEATPELLTSIEAALAEPTPRIAPNKL